MVGRLARFLWRHTAAELDQEAVLALANDLIKTFPRNATEQELSDFAGALRSYETANPTTTTTKTDRLTGKTSSTTTAGVNDTDRQAFLDKRVFGGALRNEANANAVSDYVDALQKLLGGGAR